MRKTALMLFALLVAHPLSATQTLKVAAIDWCPQICPQEENKGYIIDTFNQVFKDSQYQIEIEYFPWSRAIKAVSQGDAQILLSPAKSEAPHLLYPDEPIGYQQMCFFTQTNNPWHYTKPTSLAGQKIGIAQDSSIEELNQSISMYQDVFQFQPYHERFIKQNVGKILKGRINSFIFTKNSTVYNLRLMGVDKKFKEAGCVSKVPVYAAFTPKGISNIKTNELIDFFYSRMMILKADGTIDKIKAVYQIN